MLRAPAMEEEPVAPGCDIEPDVDDSEEEVEVIRVMPEDGRCLARTAVGCRCVNKRLPSGFCQQHQKMRDGVRGLASLVASMGR